MPLTNHILTDISGTIVHVNIIDQLVDNFRRNGVKNLRSGNEQARKLLEMIYDTDRIERTEKSAVAYVLEQIGQRNFQDRYLLLTGVANIPQYIDGTIKPVLFADVPKAFQRWTEEKRRISTYSNGNIDEQQWILRNSIVVGTNMRSDLTKYVTRSFGLESGSKTNPDSYAEICDTLGVHPKNVTFLSDRLDELDASRTSGLSPVLVIRPGNKPFGEHKYRMVTTFDMLSG